MREKSLSSILCRRRISTFPFDSDVLHTSQKNTDPITVSKYLDLTIQTLRPRLHESEIIWIQKVFGFISIWIQRPFHMSRTMQPS